MCCSMTTAAERDQQRAYRERNDRTTVTLAMDFIESYEQMRQALTEVLARSPECRAGSGGAACRRCTVCSARAVLRTAKNFSLVRRSTPAASPGKEEMA